MFTGIIETTGTVENVVRSGSNIHFTIASPISNELKIDQSVSHDGACLTVVELTEGRHTVTVIEETLQKTNLGMRIVGDQINLERCMVLGARLDGHMVQGHIDQTAVCVEKVSKNGSWLFRFSYDSAFGNVTVEKGSVGVNGISLTVVDSTKDAFSVHIIPYTYDNTNLAHIAEGASVNIEFDILGKYIARLLNPAIF